MFSALKVFIDGKRSVSRSNKKQTHHSLKSGLRKEKNRGFRRYVKLQLKAGEFNDLPEAPSRTRVEKPDKE